MYHYFTVLVGVLLTCIAPPALSDSSIGASFNQCPQQNYTGALFRHDWPTLVWDGTRNRARVMAEGNRPAEHFLRVKYPAKGVGPVQSGGQALVRLAPAEEYYLSYRVRFQEGFDFRRGGKLPGLASGDGKYSNGLHPVNGDGWTARMMWLEEGRLIPYIYYVGMPKESRWGDSWPTNTSLKPSVWYTLTQRIRLNSPGKSNGIYTIWVNGKQVTHRTDMLWRYGNKGLIDSFIFSTFHGGNTADWAPRWDCFADFDDFRISRQPPQ
ncbi:MAG: hypothetical protein PHE17_02200 [Thiothrix sp.]|uniref:polysaccharide lyase n=1 Tax=Thiothrix sp. TaxID=1032 RepID=UPI002638D415|nr:hypothetical protein [Thiothrix sp.]MDD5391811.1 hypothetical protein [Thiothrix sp.]